MNGEEFEIFLEALFSRLGYTVERTPLTGDYGADLILVSKNNRIAVQAKRYSGKVGVKAIQEVYASKAFYGCTQAAVVTNNYFTKRAKNLAQQTQVQLFDHGELKKLIRNAKNHPQKEQLCL